MKAANTTTPMTWFEPCRDAAHRQILRDALPVERAVNLRITASAASTPTNVEYALPAQKNPDDLEFEGRGTRRVDRVA